MEGGGIGELMKQAAAIKTEQVKADRRVFEAQPTFVQNTLFQCMDERVAAAREAAAAERVAVAREIKEEGNALFQRGDLFAASDKYERCIGCFWFIATTEPDWKQHGVKDEHLSYHREALDQDPAARELVVSALNNIAACQLKLQRWDACVQACDAAVELAPGNAKALFRRAQARTLPISAGAVELDMAIRDLQQALRSSPRDARVRSRFEELVRTRQKQREADKKTFTGLFERGELGGPEVDEEGDADSSSGAAAAAKASSASAAELERQLLMYKDMAHQLRGKGREADAAELDALVASTQRRLEAKQLVDRADFSNLTPDMIREAKEQHGIDLTDAAVQQELARLSKSKGPRSKATRPETALEELPEETIRQARERFGIDLSDPAVRREIEGAMAAKEKETGSSSSAGTSSKPMVAWTAAAVCVGVLSMLSGVWATDAA